MEFRKIKFTIYLVSIALLLLIVVQLFWAYSSYELSKKTFNSNVSEAMRKAIAIANENVNCLTMFSKTQIKADEGFYMTRVRRNDSTKQILSIDTIPLFAEFMSPQIPFEFNGIRFGTLLNMEAVLKFHFIMDSASADNKYLRSAAGINFNNFRDKLSDNIPIYKKYDTLLVDSLLKLQLRTYAINPKFHFGYINTDNKKIEYSSTGSDSKKLLSSQLRQKLTDNRYFTHFYDLAVYFDNNNEIIFSSIRAALILSAFVIIVLLISFYIFIRIIYRQRKLSELKNDFVNNMTHEFKTPLANISIVLETLSDSQLSESPKDNKILKILGQETERLRENIEKILQVARFEKEKIHLSFEKLDINQLIQNALSCNDIIVSAKNAELTTDFKAEDPFIMGDETHLINVVCNLIDNSLKYSQPPIRIKVSTRSNNDGVFFCVKDNGQGMSRDAQKKAFEKFYREPNGNVHTIKGFGLGLTYVKSIVEFHHGKIHLTSQPGHGSEFEIFLPHHQ